MVQGPLRAACADFGSGPWFDLSTQAQNATGVYGQRARAGAQLGTPGPGMQLMNAGQSAACSQPQPQALEKLLVLASQA